MIFEPLNHATADPRTYDYSFLFLFLFFFSSLGMIEVLVGTRWVGDLASKSLLGGFQESFTERKSKYSGKGSQMVKKTKPKNGLATNP